MTAFHSVAQRREYVCEEATEMLMFDMSYDDRRRIVASAKRREMRDFGRVGPHTLLLESEVRAELDRQLGQVVLDVHARHAVWLCPAVLSAVLLPPLLSRPLVANLLCIGADGASTPVSSRFDILEPPIRFDSMLLVSAMRPTEMGNASLLILGAAVRESKDIVERIIDESRLLPALERACPDALVYLLLDGGGVYKFAPAREQCNYDRIPTSVLREDVETTLHPTCSATCESWNMLCPIPPERICTGLLHGLATIFLRLRKKGLTEAERRRLDEWFLVKVGRPIVAAKSQAKRDRDTPASDGKLEIESMDRMFADLPSFLCVGTSHLMRLFASVARESNVMH